MFFVVDIKYFEHISFDKLLQLFINTIVSDTVFK